MIGFEVIINGEKICAAGIGEFGVLTSVMTWVGSRKDSNEGIDIRNPDLKVGGLTDSGNDADEFVDWVKRSLNIGDQVNIRIVDIVEADEPIERSSSKREPCCSFCGKTASQVVKLIGAQQVNICNLCVEVCNQVLANDEKPNFDHGAA